MNLQIEESLRSIMKLKRVAVLSLRESFYKYLKLQNQ